MRRALRCFDRLNLHAPDSGETSYILSSGAQTSSAGISVHRDANGQLCGAVKSGEHGWSICSNFEHDAWHSAAFVLAESRKEQTGYELTMYVDGGNPQKGSGTAGGGARNVYKSVTLGAPNNALKEYRGTSLTITQCLPSPFVCVRDRC